jgi:hypothetical protein
MARLALLGAATEARLLLRAAAQRDLHSSGRGACIRSTVYRLGMRLCCSAGVRWGDAQQACSRVTKGLGTLRCRLPASRCFSSVQPLEAYALAAAATDPSVTWCQPRSELHSAAHAGPSVLRTTSLLPAEPSKHQHTSISPGPFLHILPLRLTCTGASGSGRWCGTSTCGLGASLGVVMLTGMYSTSMVPSGRGRSSMRECRGISSRGICTDDVADVSGAWLKPWTQA